MQEKQDISRSRCCPTVLLLAATGLSMKQLDAMDAPGCNFLKRLVCTAAINNDEFRRMI